MADGNKKIYNMKKLILSLLLAPILLLSQPSFNVTDSNGETWNSEEPRNEDGPPFGEQDT